MTEVYPTDDALLNLLNDPETGVEYIATGAAPYYLQFRKLLYRLLLACRRGNDLRVYDEGGLDIGVKPGKFWIGDTLVSCAGSSGNTLADNKPAIYIHLDAAGNLVTDEYADWPDMAAARHVRLAVVQTSGGDIVSITDARDHHTVALPAAAGADVTVKAHTTDATLTQAQSGSVHTNAGATGVVTLTLPANPAANTQFVFCVQAAQQFRIDPGLAAIRDNSGQTAGRYKWADAIGECLTLVADASGDWITAGKYGVWTEEV
ncbi:MAG TPA: hypothetical protein P5279_00195 [Anaerohalosphaeraceae bacterium]|jgi:hypothetical protein|nr:hypothetical protein [Anaerohalosphaeraceae bacterium]HRT48884.1 hypothetical protein [Anaerohalosphaeraceae bacterium]HRT85007.1 hypothetical protein [Anaerohalosphaeraceae bacterium]